ncbi:MAG: hypothetical protein DRH11_14110 [Deltaproteobacteria bacterium]|nr:MAG: hypothetical protein DRH11_14110 [Deltaproteobacteria bacterium]
MLKRFLNNPILRPIKTHAWESKLVFNPAAIFHNGLVHLLYRAVGDDNISRIGYAMSPNGFEFFRLDKPVFTPRGILESKGCEDPRVVYLEDQFFMTYTSYSAEGSRISLASTHNFLQWKRYGVILPGIHNKDAVLFPEKIVRKASFLTRAPSWNSSMISLLSRILRYSPWRICWVSTTQSKIRRKPSLLFTKVRRLRIPYSTNLTGMPLYALMKGTGIFWRRYTERAKSESFPTLATL